MDLKENQPIRIPLFSFRDVTSRTVYGHAVKARLRDATRPRWPPEARRRNVGEEVHVRGDVKFHEGRAGEGGRRDTTTRTFACYATCDATDALSVVLASFNRRVGDIFGSGDARPSRLSGRPSRDDDASPLRDAAEVMTACSRGRSSRARMRTIIGREYTTSPIHARSTTVPGRR